ncbi:MAG: pseudouridine synthase [Candidatus Hinthialibacter antarcticus]|nr:pseudouridine synthase [Candidatus Hinthialibacter antarcticus]
MTSPKNIRLNKLLAGRGLCSRREADRWIEQGRISIDGMVCRELGVSVDPDVQRIKVDGALLPTQPDVMYIALNKPKGVVSTRRDPQGRKTVMNFLSKEANDAGVFPVGRLDADSEGLLLLTNDGNWSQQLLHPSGEVWKEYRVETTTPLTQHQIRRLKEGVVIEGRHTLEAKVKLIKERDGFFIAIREGRNRQIRKMCKVVHLEISRLQRIRIGQIELADLPSGHWRPLNKREIESISLYT